LFFVGDFDKMMKDGGMLFALYQMPPTEREGL